MKASACDRCSSYYGPQKSPFKAGEKNVCERAKPVITHRRTKRTVKFFRLGLHECRSLCVSKVKREGVKRIPLSSAAKEEGNLEKKTVNLV